MTNSQLLEVANVRPGFGSNCLGLGNAIAFKKVGSVHGANIAFCYDYCKPAENDHSETLIPSNRILLSNGYMEIKETRRQNLLRLIDRVPTKTIEELAEKVDTAPNYLSEIKNKVRNMGTRLARKMEKNFALETGWMDLPHPEEDEANQFYIKAASLEELAQQLKAKGQDQVMEIIRLLASNDIPTKQ